VDNAKSSHVNYLKALPMIKDKVMMEKELNNVECGLSNHRSSIERTESLKRLS